VAGVQSRARAIVKNNGIQAIYNELRTCGETRKAARLVRDGSPTLPAIGRAVRPCAVCTNRPVSAIRPLRVWVRNAG
jgi:hypothetical protein